MPACEDDLDRDEVVARSRSRKEPDIPEEGVRLPAPDYTREGESGFLGVEEPVVSPAERGDPPPSPPLPGPDVKPGDT
jgi:hypothetical protein